jgi:hypothetical protein
MKTPETQTKRKQETDNHSGNGQSNKAALDNHIDEILLTKPGNKIFDVRSANAWLDYASKLPPPKPLYDQLWYEQETAFLFGGSNTGKSLLAVQMGIEIAKTKPIIYFDFEISPIQWYKRYQHFTFPDNFYRVEFCQDVVVDGKKLVDEIKLTAKDKGAKILIIDNLTWLLTASEKTIEAGNFMKEISTLKRSPHDFSILIIAHTPKRDETRPVSINDMAGSMVLGNFIDTSFCIAKSSKEDSLRYVKQLKVRSSELLYGFDNVKVLEIQHTDAGYLGFGEFGYARETDHLKRVADSDFNQKKAECLALLKEKKTYAHISETLGIAKGTISKWSKLLESEEQKDDAPF